MFCLGFSGSSLRVLVLSFCLFCSVIDCLGDLFVWLLLVFC